MGNIEVLHGGSNLSRILEQQELMCRAIQESNYDEKNSIYEGIVDRFVQRFQELLSERGSIQVRTNEEEKAFFDSGTVPREVVADVVRENAKYFGVDYCDCAKYWNLRDPLHVWFFSCSDYNLKRAKGFSEDHKDCFVLKGEIPEELKRPNTGDLILVKERVDLGYMKGLYVPTDRMESAIMEVSSYGLDIEVLELRQ